MRYVIYCPIGLNTGGPEALHQLCDAIRGFGYEAVLLPMWIQGEPSREYLIYDAPIICSEQLTSQDIIITPEIQTSIPADVYNIVEGKVIIWWLSVDNCPFEFSKNLEERTFPIDPDIWRIMNIKSSKKQRYISKVRSTIGKNVRLIDSTLGLNIPRYRPVIETTNSVNLDSTKMTAITQSTYAFNLLNKFKGIQKMMVTDYINTNFTGSTNMILKNPNKKNKKLISYNLAKGGYLVDNIKKHLPNIRFVPIKGMNRNQVKELLSQSDLYLDMGYFPGRDRLPRESILSGTPVFLAYRGAARYKSDFPLENEYLIDLQVENPISVSLRINELLKDSSNIFDSQASFLDFALNNKNMFMSEVESFLNNKFSKI